MDTPEAAGAVTAAITTDQRQRIFCAPQDRRFVLVSAILASSMGFIDGSVVALAMPAIVSDLGATLAEAQWIANGYMLFLSALVLLGGAAGDLFGVRNIFAAGIAVFMAMSLACAVAPDAQTLILLRAAQGAGAAFMVPGSLAIIAKSYPVEQRGRAIGTWAAASSLTTAMGPFLGGLVLSFGADWTWRIIFAINVPIGLAALAMLFTRVPADRPKARRKPDLAGALLATLGLGLLAWGLTAFGLSPGERFLSPWFWLAVGGVLFAAFVGWERRVASPMVKLELFSSRAFSGANLYTLILFLPFSGVLFFLPMTAVSAWRVPEWQASLLFLPLSLSIATFSGLAGRMADRAGPRPMLTIGALLVGVAFAGVAATAPLGQIWRATFPFLVCMGFGMATLVSPLSTAVMVAAPDDDAGLASGINNAVARAGGLMAVAAFGALASVLYRAGLDGAPVAVEFGARPEAALPSGLEALRVTAATGAFQAIAALSALLCFAAAAIAWMTQPSWKKKAAAGPETERAGR